MTFVVYERASGPCAIVDPVLDYDPKSGRTDTASAERVAGFVHAQQLDVEWILETHAHADHLSAAAHLKRQFGGRIAIGEQIAAVQGAFKPVFNLEPEFRLDGSQFDHLFHDGETFRVLTVDEDSELVEIEYLDGDIEELDVESWHEMDLELIPEPEGWSDESDDDDDEEEDEDDWDDDDDDEDDEDDDEEEDEDEDANR